MNQDQIINELIGLQDEMANSSPEDAMIKRANELDWSVEILGRVAKVYNTAKTADHLSKSASRADSFPLIDVEALQTRFLEIPAEDPEHVVKSAAPTHADDIDLTREMEKAAGFEVCSDIPEEHRADESILEKKAEAESTCPWDDIGRPEFIQKINNEAQISVGRYNAAAANYLQGIDKAANYSSSILDISHDEQIARQQRNGEAVDMVVDSLREHAGLMHKDLKVEGEFRKLAFAGKMDSAVNDLVDMYGEALMLLKAANYLNEGMEPQEAMDKAAAGSFAGKEEEDEGNTKTKTKNKKKNDTDLFSGEDTSGKGQMSAQPTPTSESKPEADAEPKQEQKSETKSEDKPAEEGGVQPAPHRGFGDTGARAKSLATDTYNTTKQVGGDTASLLQKLVSVGGESGERRMNAVNSMLDEIQEKGPGVHDDQAVVDREVNDATRAIGVQRMINTDAILNKANPQQVLSMYNMLSRRNPELADDPEAMRMALREAVSLGGAPVENLKAISQVG